MVWHSDTASISDTVTEPDGYSIGNRGNSLGAIDAKRGREKQSDHRYDESQTFRALSECGIFLS